MTFPPEATLRTPFSSDVLLPAWNAAPPLRGRYELGKVICQRGAVQRQLGRDLNNSGAPVWVLQQQHGESRLSGSGESTDKVEFNRKPAGEEMPTMLLRGEAWPNLLWEQSLLERVRHPGLPKIVEAFCHDAADYLIEDCPTGRDLRAAWSDPGVTAATRFGWLENLADVLNVLHQAGIVLAGLRPEQVTVMPFGQVVLHDLADLWQLPPLPGTKPPYLPGTPPELLSGMETDPRADLYVFGTLLWSLLLGRDLTEADFIAPGLPHPWLEPNPDAHPLLGRLLGKTLNPDRERRFPTAETAELDPSGFTELRRELAECQKWLDRPRLDAAAWSNTGLVRGGNEDAYSVIHLSDGRRDERGELLILLLADGMGGTDAGEIAAAVALDSLRASLGGSVGGPLAPDGPAAGAALEAWRDRMSDAMHEANNAVHAAADSGQGQPGMGCTAEAVVTDGRHLLLGHVGDSRVYVARAGRLEQLTRDHTLVSRLVELGHITADEARFHPRRTVLHQAVGGRCDLEPELAYARLQPGDWVLVCSDGLSGSVDEHEIATILGASRTADQAARRLVNRANLHGAPDNVTVIVLRLA